MSQHSDLIRAQSRPLAPVPTDAAPVLRRMAEMRAVLFDVYGTLFVSASGDVGTAGAGRAGAFEAALAALGLSWQGDPDDGPQGLEATIRAGHAQARAAGIEHPEVEIDEIWGRALHVWCAQGRLEAAAKAVDTRRLAIEYEVRVNPVWPMPNLSECLAALRRAGLSLGIVSNAQFFTPELFPALLGRRAEALGFAPELQFFSYRHGHAKPGTLLYEQAAQALVRRGIGAAAVLYVGNDMLNDVWPARRLGFRTALFAGDGRSLRWRRQDPRVRAVEPDLVVKDLLELVDCLGANG